MDTARDIREEEVVVIRCPKCASSDIRYSYTQTLWDMVLDLLFSLDAFRCRSCRYRFHKFDPNGEDEVVQARREPRSNEPSKF